ncbi:MAG: phage baseplate assembly protein V [Rhodospirillaceae bacterium]|nr:phage baseplate assembly protein V [Rhodospirillaceae bacterium]
MSDGKLYGKYRGRIVDNLDPMQRGRVSVSVPAVLGEAAIWAELCAPFLAAGAVPAIPPIGTDIWVEFEGGDPDFPICAGQRWSAQGEDLPMPDQPFVAPGAFPGGNVTLEELPGGGIAWKLEAGGVIAFGPDGIRLDNGRGASILLQGPSVSVNGGALTVV